MANATFVGSDECRNVMKGFIQTGRGRSTPRMDGGCQKDPAAILGDFDAPTAPKSFKNSTSHIPSEAASGGRGL